MFYRFDSAITILAVGIVATIVCQVLANNEFRTFKDLHAATNRLESAELLSQQKNPQSLARRAQLLALFARDNKTDQCSYYFNQVNKLADEYKAKAITYIDEVKNQNGGWFKNIFANTLNSMKGLSKTEPLLQEITFRYEQQASQLSESDINCDMIKFKINALDAIVYVLATDIKYLAIEDRQILNRNIHLQLSQNKYMAKHNFYKIQELKPSQTDLLLQFYLTFKDNDEVTIREAIEHSHNPGSLIIGRLMDTCHALNSYKQAWDDLESERKQQCRDTTNDLKSLIRITTNVAKYERVLKFCDNLRGTIALDVE